LFFSNIDADGDLLLGIIVPTGEAAKKEKERFDFVAIGTDVQALQRFYAKELEDARS
jgi:hypothetical protein